MFGNSKESEDTKKTTSSSSTSGALNALVKGTVVEGAIKCDSDMRVDGTIKGKLNCASKVIIGPTGAIEGEVHCQNAVIEGRFKGTLHVTDLLSVRETAAVEGDVTTNKLLVQSGANFNVSCKMDTGLSGSNGVGKNFDGKATSNASATEKIAGGKAEVRN